MLRTFFTFLAKHSPRRLESGAPSKRFRFHIYRIIYYAMNIIERVTKSPKSGLIEEARLSARPRQEWGSGSVVMQEEKQRNESLVAISPR